MAGGQRLANLPPSSSVSLKPDRTRPIARLPGPREPPGVAAKTWDDPCGPGFFLGVNGVCVAGTSWPGHASSLPPFVPSRAPYALATGVPACCHVLHRHPLQGPVGGLWGTRDTQGVSQLRRVELSRFSGLCLCLIVAAASCTPPARAGAPRPCGPQSVTFTPHLLLRLWKPQRGPNGPRGRERE